MVLSLATNIPQYNQKVEVAVKYNIDTEEIQCMGNRFDEPAMDFSVIENYCEPGTIVMSISNNGLVVKTTKYPGNWIATECSVKYAPVGTKYVYFGFTGIDAAWVEFDERELYQTLIKKYPDKESFKVFKAAIRKTEHPFDYMNEYYPYERPYSKDMLFSSEDQRRLLSQPVLYYDYLMMRICGESYTIYRDGRRANCVLHYDKELSYPTGFNRFIVRNEDAESSFFVNEEDGNNSVTFFGNVHRPTSEDLTGVLPSFKVLCSDEYKDESYCYLGYDYPETVFDDVVSKKRYFPSLYKNKRHRYLYNVFGVTSDNRFQVYQVFQFKRKLIYDEPIPVDDPNVKYVYYCRCIDGNILVRYNEQELFRDAFCYNSASNRLVFFKISAHHVPWRAHLCGHDRKYDTECIDCYMEDPEAYYDTFMASISLESYVVYRNGDRYSAIQYCDEPMHKGFYNFITPTKWKEMTASLLSPRTWGHIIYSMEADDHPEWKYNPPGDHEYGGNINDRTSEYNPNNNDDN